MTSNTCHRCGAVGEGNYCAFCGTSLGTRHCPDCGTAIAAAARFCNSCGRRLQYDGTNHSAHTIPHVVGRDSWRRWAVIGVLPAAIFAVVIWLVIAADQPIPPAPGAAPSAALPDLSDLPPRERFLRLADLVQGAIQSGDSAAVVRLFPSVETAFLALGKEERDIDARFHLSLLRAEVGHFPGAVAQLDSIVAAAPAHLFADYLRALIADFEGDTTAAREARLAFRRHYDAEIAAARPEYQAHRSLLDDFLKTTPSQ